MNRREFLLKPLTSLCDDPKTVNNQVCQDPALKARLDSGDQGTINWFYQEQVALENHSSNSVENAAENAKCLVIPGLTLAAAFKWLYERRKRIALEGTVAYTQE